jgi:glutamate N-acetyltransferase/amino-acid N-acetyltransferase
MAGVAQAGIKHPGRYDLALVLSKAPAAAAGVFTTNKFQAAPVLVSKEHLAREKARGFVVNSGCANACTGEQGLDDARAMAGEAAKSTGCESGEMLVASTGVIGVPLPMDKILLGVREAAFGLSVENGSLAARAIMTTDTFPKETAVRFMLNGKAVTIGGMAKGSGMIHPDMATLLGFVATDAAVTPRCLKLALRSAVDCSFNMVTVDRDTSTNDSLFVLANGLAGNAPVDDENSEEYGVFQEALTQVCVELARMVARDGEGATKLVEVRVINAPTEADARAGARSIAASNLVKAAVFGEDANWGRIVCALGYSGASFEPALVDVYLGDLQVARNGCGLAFDEERAAGILAGNTVVIKVDLKQGSAGAVAWGCDLTYDYVKINGAYRT